METKECKKCGCEQPLNRFDWSDKAKGYKKSYCRSCSINIHNEWKEKYPKNYEERWKAYYTNNPHKYGKTNKPKGRPMNDELKSGVYLITNTITNETYVGCSKNVKRRIWRHLDYNRGRSKNKLISKALKQYGREAFSSEVLEYCLPTEIFKREDYWMTQYGCEYNNNKKK